MPSLYFCKVNNHVTSKPANGIGRPGLRMFYPAASCGGKSVLVRQLRGPHLSTWPWCSKRSSMARTAAASPSSLPQSSTKAVGGQHGAGPFVAAHDDLQQFFGGGEGQLAHSELIEDEQRHGHQKLHVLFAGAIEGGFGQVIEQGVGLAIEHAVTLLDGGLADGLRQVTLAGAGWAEKQGIFVARDEGASGQIEDQAAIHLLVESEVEVVEGLVRVAELGLLFPPLQQALAAQGQFVGDQTGEQVDGSEWFGLGLAQTGLQRGDHSAQAKLFESTIEFDQIHSSISLVL